MDAREYLEQRAIEVGYESFHHYCDCRHEDDQAKEMPEWLESYHQAKSKEEAKIRYIKSWKAIPRHLGTLDKMEVKEALKLAAFGSTKAILSKLKERYK